MDVSEEHTSNFCFEEYAKKEISKEGSNRAPLAPPKRRLNFTGIKRHYIPEK
jgi:hypothetical protein